MVLRYACGLDISLRLFFVTFSQVELSHFSGIIDNNVNGQGIPCGHNSSYSFIPIISKLHWCFGHGLKICMWLRYNPQIILLCHFFCKLNLPVVIFQALYITKWMDRGYLVGAIPPSFIQILLKLHWCLGHGLKICMWFGYNPQIIFCLFFRKLNLAIFTGIIDNNVNGQGIPCGPNSSYSFIPILSKLHVVWI